MHPQPDPAAAPDKVAVLAHYRREAAATLTPARGELTLVTPERLAGCVWQRQAIDPQRHTEAQVRQVVDVLVRQVLAVNAVFGPVHIDLGAGRRVVCTMQIDAGERA